MKRKYPQKNKQRPVKKLPPESRVQPHKKVKYHRRSDQRGKGGCGERPSLLRGGRLEGDAAGDGERSD